MGVVSCADVSGGLLQVDFVARCSEKPCQSVRGNLGQPLGEKGMMMMMMMRNLGQQSGKPEGDLGSLRTLGQAVSQ